MTDVPKKKRRPPQKPWVNRFPCGHTKRRKDCVTCCALRKDRSRSVEARFTEKYVRRGMTECWPWTGSKDRFGRGYFYYEGKVTRAPRVAWTLHHGMRFPDGKDACHSCDNPSCVNPAHIWPGSESDNLRDAENKGRVPHRIGEEHVFAKLTEEQVRAIRVRHAAGEAKADLAREFAVNSTTVHGVIIRKSWKHVA